jgi:hypothetical protein
MPSLSRNSAKAGKCPLTKSCLGENAVIEAAP